MQEKARNVISGETTQTTSSDEFVAGRVREIQAEIEGTTGVEVDVDISNSDVYPPRTATGQINQDHTSDQDSYDITKIIPIPTLTHRHSAFGYAAVKKRTLKKAA